MNLTELGSFKDKIVQKFLHDPNIIDALIGPVDEDTDVEKLLLGKTDSGEDGHIFKYEYVPDTQEDAKAYLTCEVLPTATAGSTVREMTIYVFAFCSKNIMTTYHRTGAAGTRPDILISDVDKILIGNKEFGIGPIQWEYGNIYKPTTQHYGRMAMYSVSTFQ